MVASLWVTGTNLRGVGPDVHGRRHLGSRAPFLGRTPEALAATHEGPAAMWVGPLVLGGLSLWFGLFSDLPEQWLVAPATWAVYGSTAVEVRSPPPPPPPPSTSSARSMPPSSCRW